MKILKNKGIATLPTIIVLGMMVLVVVVSITSMSLNELTISKGQSESSTALFYSEAGARDALVKIARDKTYACATADCYNIDYITNGCSLGTDCAKVTVSSGDGTTANPKIITSKGIMKSSIRRMQVSVLLDNGTSVASDQKGEITSALWTELTN